MPADLDSCLLSVRAQAHRTVEPDLAVLHASVTAVGASKRVAQQDLALSTEVLTGGLGELGGTPARADAPRQVLTWATHSIHTEQVHSDDKLRPGPTGRHSATLTITVEVRDFVKLADVLGLLTDRDEISLHTVSWEVDVDNPAWALVRADAIRAALIKGQDYAAALGGRVERVHHVADAGLLGGDVREFAHQRGRALAASGLGPHTALDPEPQVVTAMIDARLITTVGELPERAPR